MEEDAPLDGQQVEGGELSLRDAPVLEESSQPAPEVVSSGWGSWGSWISSTVTQVVEKSSKIVQDLTTEAEEEQIPTPSTLPARKVPSAAPNPLKLYRTEEDMRAEEDEPDLETKLLSATSEAFSETTSFLNTMISKGIDQLHQIDVDSLRQQAESVSRKAPVHAV